MYLTVIQSHRSWDYQENLAYMLNHLKKIQYTDLILLPENWLAPAIIPWKEYQAILEKLSSQLSSKILLAAGAQYISIDDQFLSRGAFLRHGEPPIFYEKLFPSQAIGERGVMLPGNLSATVEHQGIKISAVVCVDLFYPEVIRQKALQGAKVILNPANIPRSRLSLWQAIGRTRAAENTVFLVMACNTGTQYEDGRVVEGGSFVAYPDGRQVLSFGKKEGIFSITLDPSLIEDIRKRWPYLDDVRGL